MIARRVTLRGSIFGEKYRIAPWCERKIHYRKPQGKRRVEKSEIYMHLFDKGIVDIIAKKIVTQKKEEKKKKWVFAGRGLG